MNDALDAHNSCRTYRTLTEHDEKTGEEVVRLHITDPLPASLGAIVGDVLHNTRSALDVLAHTLVRASGATPHEVQTRFPIVKDPTNLDKDIASALRGASERTHRIVKWLQPVHGANNPLYLLHHLSNLDKHRLLTPVLTGLSHFDLIAPDEIEGTTNNSAGYEITALFPTGMTFADGDELMRYRRSEPAMPLMDGLIEFEFLVTLGGDSSQPVVHQLEAIVRYVERVVVVFERGVRPPMV